MTLFLFVLNKNMSARLKIKLFALIILIYTAIGISLGGLLHSFWPEHYFSWYPSIPGFYCITALAMVFFLDYVKQKKGDVTVTTFMIVRISKLILAVFFLWIYAKFVGEKMKAFGLTLMLFYFIYLTLETYTVYLFEKKRLKKKKQ